MTRVEISKSEQPIPEVGSTRGKLVFSKEDGFTLHGRILSISSDSFPSQEKEEAHIQAIRESVYMQTLLMILETTNISRIIFETD